jgi:glycosyltransferase involved in cell wall biosynthesis
MELNKPLVSVLMTSYNREQYIAAAIESVLASTYTNFELIIVDDGSKDQTVEIARNYERADKRVRVYVNEQNLGDYPNRNKAASYASGKYIKYVDADDFLYYFGLEIAVNMTERFPEAGFGLGAYPDDNSPFPVLVQPREIYLENFYQYHHFDRAPGSGLIKLEAFNKVGGFSGKRMIGDNEFWFKISRYYSMVKLPIDLYWNRLHEGQESKTAYAKKNYKILRAQVIKEALEHPDCPLNSDEIKVLKNFMRKRQLKETVLEKLAGIKSKILK